MRRENNIMTWVTTHSDDQWSLSSSSPIVAMNGLVWRRHNERRAPYIYMQEPAKTKRKKERKNQEPFFFFFGWWIFHETLWGKKVLSTVIQWYTKSTSAKKIKPEKTIETLRKILKSPFLWWIFVVLIGNGGKNEKEEMIINHRYDQRSHCHVVGHLLTNLFNRPKGSNLYIHTYVCIYDSSSSFVKSPFLATMMWLLLIILKVENREKVEWWNYFF